MLCKWKPWVIFLVTVTLVLAGLPRIFNEYPGGAVYAQEMDLRSQSAVLMDAASGQVLYAKNENEPRAPASIAKIMTLVLAFEALSKGRIGLSDIVVGSEHAKSLGGSTIYLDAGEEMSVKDLLMGIALASANDASVAIAEHIAGTEEKFVEMMNRKAQEIGLKNTQFRNSHGLDEEGQHVSAYDMALLSRYAVNVYPEMLKFTSIYDGGYLRENDPKRRFKLWNTNKLVRFYSGADGLKTGSTDKAGFGVAATAKRGDTRMIAVVLGAPNSAVRFAEARKLLDYGFANYVTVPVARKNSVEATVRVYKGTRSSVNLVVAEDFGVTVLKGQEAGLRRQVKAPGELTAPLAVGAAAGEVVATTKDGKELGKVALVVADEVPRATLLELIRSVLTEVFAGQASPK